jgi:hemolysin activation/secretion protein
MLAVAVPMSSTVQAQGIQEGGRIVQNNAREEEYLRRREQAREIDEGLLPYQSKPVSPIAKPTQPAESSVAGVGAKFVLSQIAIDWAGEPAIAQADEIAQTYVGKLADSQGLFHLVKAVSGRLFDAGYVTSTVTIPEQSLAQGQLTLQVNWGRIAGWKLDGRMELSARERVLLGSALPDAPGRRLNIRDIDQALENLRKSGREVKLEIEPAPQAGFSYLHVRTEAAPRPTLDLGVQGGGSGAFHNGRDRFFTSLGVGGLLTGNDLLVLDAGGRYYAEGDKNHNYHANLLYAVPLGYTTLEMRYAYTNYERLLKTQYGEYSSDGSTSGGGIRLIRTLTRDQTSRWDGYVDLSTTAERNYIEQTLIEVNSKHYTSATLGVRYAGRAMGGAMYADLGLWHGLPLNQGAPAAIEPDGSWRQMRKLTLIGGWAGAVNVLGRPLTVALRASGQYSDQFLLDRYKIGIGDEYSVRGYEYTPVLGDTGAYLSSTVSVPFDLQDYGLGRVTTFAGLDAGVARHNLDGVSTQGLVGAAVGVRLERKWVSAGVTLGYPLWTRQLLREVPRKPIVYINATFSL